ncbi:MAG: YigZ family protein [Treponema sp.]|nr:YigZ family protein [Treponema sp.]
MEIIKEYVKYEENIKGSRFLSELFPCTSQSEARELIKSQKEKYSDATHVVHAFVIGPSGEVMGMSDDGEPSGTAGRPALDVLKGRKCTNTVLTITRWFGGTLLGTGGLVKAYSGGAKAVLTKADEAELFEELVEKSDFSLCCGYEAYKTIKKIMEGFHISELKEDFGTQVDISGKLYAAEKKELSDRILDCSNGKITLK